MFYKRKIATLLYLILYLLLGSEVEGYSQDVVSDCKSKSCIERYLEIADSLNPIDSKQSLMYANKVKTGAIKYNDSSLLSKALYISGRTYWAMSIYDRSILDFEKFKKVNENLKDSSNLAIAENFFGHIYIKGSFYDLAQEHYFKSKTIAEKINNADELATAYNGLGQVCFRKKDFNCAIANYILSLKTAQENDIKFRIPRAFANMAESYLAMGELKKAEEYLLLARKQGHKGKYEAFYEANTLGEVYSKLGKLNLALIELNKAKELAHSNMHSEMILENNRAFSNYYKHIGDYKTALLFQEEFQRRNDSINSVVKKNGLIRAIDILKHEANSNEIKKVKRELKLSSQQVQIQRFIKIIWVGGTVSIFIISILIYIRYKEKVNNQKIKHKELSKKLDFRNSSLINYSLLIDKRNEQLEKHSELLKKLESEPGTFSKERLRDIIFSFDLFITKSFEHESIKEKLNEEITKYESGLKQKFPKLNNTDIQLCKYLRLNLTLLEIAEINNTSIEEMSKLRANLRKKIGLTEVEDLVGFLKGI